MSSWRSGLCSQDAGLFLQSLTSAWAKLFSFFSPNWFSFPGAFTEPLEFKPPPFVWLPPCIEYPTFLWISHLILYVPPLPLHCHGFFYVYLSQWAPKPKRAITTILANTHKQALKGYLLTVYYFTFPHFYHPSSYCSSNYYPLQVLLLENSIFFYLL